MSIDFAVRRWIAPAVTLVVAVAVLAAVERPAGGEPVASAVAGSARGTVPDTAYRPPVSAPVTDPFRAPSDPYGAGNRGLEYGTEPDTPVGAAADGVVTFAGPVAGDLWVTVGHDDGIRTAYGPLASMATVAGATVRAGQTIGTTRDRLLFTARLGDTYLDPAILIATSPGSVRLVPEDSSPAAVPKGIIATGTLDPAWFRRAVAWVRDAAHDARVAVSSLVGGDPLDLLPVPTPFELFAAGIRWWDQRGRCSRPDVQPVPPPTRRVAIEVAGLGSTSTAAAVWDVDVDALGYDPGDALRFSYRGGRAPGNAATDFEAIDVSAYSAVDTLGDVIEAGHRLAELIQAAGAALPPNVPIDVIAHSQGGIVARLAVAELAMTAPTTLDRIGLVVTLGTPHRGADLAGLVSSLVESEPLAVGLEVVQDLLGLTIEPDAIVVHQLAPGSEVVRRLAATPLPDGLDLLSIAARSDPVVPSPRSHVRGATNLVIGVEGLNDHDALPASAGATREIGLALGGLPPSCEGLLDVMGDTAIGEAIAGLEGLISLAGRAGATAAGG